MIRKKMALVVSSAIIVLGLFTNKAIADSIGKVDFFGKIVEIDTPTIEQKNVAEKWKISNNNGEETILIRNANGEITYYTNGIENLDVNNSIIMEKENTTSNTKDKEETECKSKEGRYIELGEFKITHYCSCSICCGKWGGHTTSSGTKPTTKRTIAVDPKVIPMGTKVIINGQEYIAEDTGSAVKNNVIDIYVSSHLEAKQKGVYYAKVYKELS